MSDFDCFLLPNLDKELKYPIKLKEEEDDHKDEKENDCLPASVLSQRRRHCLRVTDNMIEKYRRDNHILGMSVAVSVDGNIIYARGCGHQDEAEEVKATPHMTGTIGKLCRPFISYCWNKINHNCENLMVANKNVKTMTDSSEMQYGKENLFYKNWLYTRNQKIDLTNVQDVFNNEMKKIETKNTYLHLSLNCFDKKNEPLKTNECEPSYKKPSVRIVSNVLDLLKFTNIFEKPLQNLVNCPLSEYSVLPRFRQRLSLNLDNNDKGVYVRGSGNCGSNWSVQTFVQDANEEKEISKRYKTIIHHTGAENGFSSHISSCTWGSRDPITDKHVAKKPAKEVAKQLTKSCSFDAYRCPDEDCDSDVVSFEEHQGESETVSVAIICNKFGEDLSEISKKIVDNFSHAFVGK